MSFKLSDFKKTTRGSGESRQIYPHQIRDDRYTAAISYALGYYERMVGRRRAEFESETLLEFFGDPRLARGLVACLGGAYLWLNPDPTAALGPAAAAALRRAGVGRPAELRARLFALANARYGGFVPPAERQAALRDLAAELQRSAEGAAEWTAGLPADAPPPQVAGALPAEVLERALTLDADEERVLTRPGPTPTPDEIVARYNYHSLETALCYAERINLRMRGPVWAMLRSAHNLARRYRIGYSVGDLPGSLFDERLELTLLGRRDALGGWGRAGRRLARAVLRLLAAHPGCAVEGSAFVHAGGQGANVRLDSRAITLLGARAAASVADDAWEDSAADELQMAWARLQSRGRTDGWGLRRDPEPLVGTESLVLPDFALRRGASSAALCLATGRAAAEALADAIKRLGPTIPLVVLAPAPAASALRGLPASVIIYGASSAEAAPQIVTTLGTGDRRQAGSKKAG